MSSEAGEESIDFFQEPADFYEPEKEASFASHTLLSGKELTVRLVGHNPLWVSFLVKLQPFHGPSISS
jgi:nicotinamide N-methyltransferase